MPSKIGNGFQVSTYAANSNYQRNAAVEALNNGGFMVTWASGCLSGAACQNGSGFGIYDQVFTANGNNVGNELRINNYTTNDQLGPSVAVLTNVDFMVTAYVENEIKQRLYLLSKKQLPQISREKTSKTIEDHFELLSIPIFYQAFIDIRKRIEKAYRLKDFGGIEEQYKFLIQMINQSFDHIEELLIQSEGKLFITGSKSQDEIAKEEEEKITKAESFPSAAKSNFYYKLASCLLGLAREFLKGYQHLLNYTAEHPYQMAALLFNARVYAAQHQKRGTAISPEFQVNTYLSVNTGFAKATRLSNGNFIVCWHSDNQDVSGINIYGQFFTVSGSKIGGEFLVNTYTVSDQWGPAVTSLTDGNFVVVWHSNGQDGSSYGVYGQIFTATGTKVGSEFRVNTYTTGNQSGPSVASLSSGNFVIVWTSENQDGSSYGAYGQICTANGTKVGSEFRINTTTDSYQWRPTVVSLSTGGFIVAWETHAQDGADTAIFGQLYTATGSKIGSEFRFNTYVAGYQSWPAVASLPNDNYVGIWQSEGQDGSGYGIFGQLFTSTGSKIGGEFQINSYTLADQQLPAVTSLSSGNFVVVWQSQNQDGSLNGIYGQLFTAAGNKLGGEFPINTLIANEQQWPAVASLSNDNFVVVWENDGQTSSGFGIYGRISSNTVSVIPLYSVQNYTEDQSLLIGNVSIDAFYNPPTTATFKLPSANIGSLMSTVTLSGVIQNFDNTTATWQASGERLSINQVLSQLTYQPALNYNGNFTLDFSIIAGYPPNITLTGQMGLQGIPINDVPVIINNQLSILQGGNITLSSSNLSASDVEIEPGLLNFNIQALQYGWFQLSTNPFANVTNFLQQKITNSELIFYHDGSAFAPSYQVSVNDETSTSLWQSASILFNSRPVIVLNSLQFQQKGETIVLSRANNLLAEDSNGSGPPTSPANLTFTISNIQNGRFELISNPGVTITIFTQQQIDDGQVQFIHDGSDKNPTYLVIVSDGILSSPPSTVTVSGLGNAKPVLINVKLIVTEGEITVLTNSDFNATDTDNTPDQLTYTISGLNVGRFELMTNPGVAVISFTQAQINAGQVRYVHDGSELAPAFEITVTDSFGLATASIPAIITFIKVNDAPQVFKGIGNTRIGTGELLDYQVLASDVFIDPDGDPLTYSASLADGTRLPGWLNFNVINNNTLMQFKGTPSNIELDQVKVTATDPSNAMNSTEFSIDVRNATLIDGKPKNILPIAAGASVGGVIGLAALAGGIFGIWRYRKAKDYKEKREANPLANLLRTELNLAGVENFDSEDGLAYLNAIETLKGELALQGIDVNSMFADELKKLTTYLAPAISAHVSMKSAAFNLGQKLDYSELQQKAGLIAKQAKGAYGTTAGQASTTPGGDIEMNPVPLLKMDVLSGNEGGDLRQPSPGTELAKHMGARKNQF